jgi:hypothetical protein
MTSRRRTPALGPRARLAAPTLSPHAPVAACPHTVNMGTTNPAATAAATALRTPLPLHAAVMRKDLAGVRALLLPHTGVDVNAGEPLVQRAPLHYAARLGLRAIARNEYRQSVAETSGCTDPALLAILGVQPPISDSDITRVSDLLLLSRSVC